MKKTFPNTVPERISSPGGNWDSLFIIFLKIDYVKDLLKKSKCDIL